MTINICLAVIAIHLINASKLSYAILLSQITIVRGDLAALKFGGFLVIDFVQVMTGYFVYKFGCLFDVVIRV